MLCSGQQEGQDAQNQEDRPRLTVPGRSHCSGHAQRPGEEASATPSSSSSSQASCLLRAPYSTRLLMWPQLPDSGGSRASGAEPTLQLACSPFGQRHLSPRSWLRAGQTQTLSERKQAVLS